MRSNSEIRLCAGCFELRHAPNRFASLGVIHIQSLRVGRGVQDEAIFLPLELYPYFQSRTEKLYLID
jgi:hypothetical protein